MVAVSTVKAGFVIVILGAGYHVELAGSDHYNEPRLPKSKNKISRVLD
jgi:enoyl reductase-like protein